MEGGCGMKRERAASSSAETPGFLADVGEVRGKAVAEVDGGSGQAAALEPEALGEARLRVEMRRQCGSRALGILSCVVLPVGALKKGPLPFPLQISESAAAAPPRAPVT